jgi:Predicted Fe-S oxidoreductases
MPLRQSLRVGSYLMRQKLAGNKKFPLLVELEPLFACNLKCAGCGKIQQPHTILKQRMPVEQAIGAVEESGAPDGVHRRRRAADAPPDRRASSPS